MFSSGLILGGHECLCATSQKRHLLRVILFTVNDCLFANSDVSIRFNGKDDNVVLESLNISPLHFTIGFYTQGVLEYVSISTGKQRRHMINGHGFL